MRHFTVSTALLAGCLIAGAAWAQGSSGGSSGGSTGGTGGSSTSASPSTGSTASPSTAGQPSGTTLRRPAQGMRGSADPANRSSRVGGTTGNTGAGGRESTGTIPPPGTEGSTGGSQTGPAETGTVAGNRLQSGERSTVGPSSREEKLLEEADKRVRRGICQGC